MISKVLFALGGIAAFTVPVFSSGLRRNLTFARFIYNHTIFGDFPLYVPREITETALCRATEMVTVSNGCYLVQKRNASQVQELRDFITPKNAMVQEYAALLWDTDPEQRALSCWQWVCENLTWYLQEPDFWNYPAEVLDLYEDASSRGMKAAADCDDSAYLLTSLLLANDIEALANIGFYNGELHAWTTVFKDGLEYIFEATLTGAQMERLLEVDPWLPVGDSPEYRPLWKFDHEVVYDLTAWCRTRPGGLDKSLFLV